MTAAVNSIATIGEALDRARKMAIAGRTTIYVHGSGTDGYRASREPADDRNRAARVSSNGIIAFWSEAIGRYVTVPED
jgi:hypothetical protein